MIQPNRAFLGLLLLFVLLFSGIPEGCVSTRSGNRSSFRDSEFSDAYQRGVEYYGEGLYKSTVAELRTIPPSHPDFRKARVYLEKAKDRVTRVEIERDAAQELTDQGRLAEAHFHLKKALEIYPKNNRILGFLKDLEARMDRQAEQYLNDGIRLFEESRLDESIGAFEKAYGLRSDNSAVSDHLANAYNSRALKYYREENLSLAIRDLSRSLRIKPGQPTIRDQLDQIRNRQKLLQKIDP
jgi:tetratricopeptide (TPR) repeat protein